MEGLLIGFQHCLLGIDIDKANKRTPARNMKSNVSLLKPDIVIDYDHCRHTGNDRLQLNDVTFHYKGCFVIFLFNFNEIQQNPALIVHPSVALCQIILSSPDFLFIFHETKVEERSHSGARASDPEAFKNIFYL